MCLKGCCHACICLNNTGKLTPAKPIPALISFKGIEDKPAACNAKQADSTIASVLEELEQDLNKGSSSITSEEEEQSIETENEPMGLMARRTG